MKEQYFHLTIILIMTLLILYVTRKDNKSNIKESVIMLVAGAGCIALGLLPLLAENNSSLLKILMLSEVRNKNTAWGLAAGYSIMLVGLIHLFYAFIRNILKK